MDQVFFIANTVMPVFLIVALGYFLMRAGLVNNVFINISTKLVFTVALPMLIFTELSSVDIKSMFNAKLIIFVYVTTLFAFVLSWLVSRPFIKDGKSRGVFIQGSFRSNYAIVGLAIISNLFGKSGLAKASIILVFLIPLYNILSVIALTVPVRKEKGLNLKDTLFEIAKNPLILAVIASLPFAYFKISIGPVLRTTGEYLASIALPLALIGIGGSLNLKNLKEASAIAFSSTFLKIIFYPLLFTIAAVETGFYGNDLAILFITFACPTAVVSYVMAEAMGSNGKLAGNIVLASTLASVLTITAGLVILKFTGLF